MNRDQFWITDRQRMIEDMNARKLCAGTQAHIRSCKRSQHFSSGHT
jgi:hypothetical protein